MTFQMTERPTFVGFHQTRNAPDKKANFVELKKGQDSLRELLNGFQDWKRFPAVHPIMINCPLLRVVKPDNIQHWKIDEVCLRLNLVLLGQLRISEEILNGFRFDWLAFFLMMYDALYVAGMEGHPSSTKAASSQIFDFLGGLLEHTDGSTGLGAFRGELREAGAYILRLFAENLTELTDYNVFAFLAYTEEFPRGKELIDMMRYTQDKKERISNRTPSG